MSLLTSVTREIFYRTARAPGLFFFFPSASELLIEIEGLFGEGFFYGLGLNHLNSPSVMLVCKRSCRQRSWYQENLYRSNSGYIAK